ncbi:MAG TPA: protein kinase [Polyangiaceae bacterium]|nr:protein kinase [Polyangiaceae bacterium]
MQARNADDELQVEAEQRVGRVLRDKWRLDHLIGIGGMGAVYTATHRNGSRGAVKVLHAALTLSREVRTRFMREGYAANQVNHPGVVQVIDDDEDQGMVFLVMELLEGETLEQRWLRKGSRLPADEVLSVADQVLDVLAAAHDKGIVHRDLKPENLFLTKEGRIKVLDFGIARLRHASTSPRSHTGGTFGTPAFMPPEQALGHTESVDARSDLWSLGATLFTLISGRLVHEGTTVNEQLLSAMTRSAPPLQMVASCVSREVAELVDRALSRDKSSRFEDAVSMQQAVREAYEALSEGFDSSPTIVVSDVARPPSGAPPRSESVRPAISSLVKHRGILTSASVGFFAVAGFYAFHDSSPPLPAPAVVAVRPPVLKTGPALVVNAATARTPSLVPSSRAPREATPKALSVDDLPRDMDDESYSRPHPLTGVSPALASAMSRVAGVGTPAMPVRPAVPVQPKDVHLEESPPSPYDDPNPYDEPRSVSGARAHGAPAQHARP